MNDINRMSKFKPSSPVSKERLWRAGINRSVSGTKNRLIETLVILLRTILIYAIQRTNGCMDSKI